MAFDKTASDELSRTLIMEYQLALAAHRQKAAHNEHHYIASVSISFLIRVYCVINFRNELRTFPTSS